MEIQGVVQNGVVVLDGAVSLPEGATVTVTYRAVPVIRVAPNPKPVVLPIFDSDERGAIDLTNDRIAEILDQECRHWSVSGGLRELFESALD